MVWTMTSTAAAMPIYTRDETREDTPAIGPVSRALARATRLRGDAPPSVESFLVVHHPSVARELLLAGETEDHHQGLLHYLDSLAHEATRPDSRFSLEAVENAWFVWQTLRDFFGDQDAYLAVPNACPGEDDNVLFSWDSTRFYAECEIFGDGRVEYFYRNKETEAFDSEEVDVTSSCPENVMDWLSHFAG